MVPTTVGAVIAFIGLVIPGLVYSELRARAATPVPRDPFDRIGVIIIVSAVCTTLAMGALWMLAQFLPSAVADMTLLLTVSDYGRLHYRLVALNGAMVVLSAVALSIAGHRLADRRPAWLVWISARILGESRNRSRLTPWRLALGRPTPLVLDGKALVYVTVVDDAGTTFSGTLATFHDTADEDGQTLVLAQPMEICHLGGKPACPDAQLLVIPAANVRAVYVKHVGPAASDRDSPALVAPPRNPSGR